MSVRPIRRRAKPTLLTRLRMFWIFIVAGAVLAAAAGYVLVTRPEFRVHAISVSGNHVVSQRDVVAAAAIPYDANVWTLDTKSIAGRIEAIPFVSTAAVHRHWPADVELQIVERIPAACIDEPGGAVTMDAQRRVLATRCLSGQLPYYRMSLAADPKAGDFLDDEDVGRVQQDVEIVEASGLHVRTIGFDRFGSLEVETTSGLRLRCGDDADLEKKVGLVGPILDATKNRLRQVETIDLRAPTTPVVTYR